MVWAKDSERDARVRLLDLDAAPLHLGEHGRERPLQRLVDRGDGFGREPGFQDHPEPQADIGLLAGIFGGARHLDAVKRDRVAPRPHDLLLGQAGIREETPRKLGGQMLRAAGIERIGDQAGIVDARKRYAVARERHHVELGVLYDLEHALVFQDRLEQIECRAHGDLRDRVAAEIEPVARAMGERHVGRVARHERERHADQLTLHRVRRIELRPEGEMALIARSLQQIGKTRDFRHRLVIRAVEGDGFQPGRALDGELRRRAALGLALRSDCGAARAAPQGMIVVVLLLPLWRGRRRHAFGQLGAEPFGHAAEQRGEFELAHEGGKRLRVGRAHRRFGQGHLDRHMCIENDQRLRQPRLVGERDQALAAFVLFDLRGAVEQRFEIAIFVDEQRRGFHPDPRHARHIVRGIADQRLHLDDLCGRHAEALDYLGLADRLVLHRVVHDDAGLHELHQVLVGGDDGHVGAGLHRLQRIGGDDVVGLVAFLLDAGDVEGAHGVAHQRELRNEIARRLGSISLVAVEQIAPEGLGGIVEDHRDMRRRREFARLAQQLPQHGAEAVHGADGQPVRRARQGRQRMIGAEDVT